MLTATGSPLTKTRDFPQKHSPERTTSEADIAEDRVSARRVRRHVGEKKRASERCDASVRAESTRMRRRRDVKSRVESDASKATHRERRDVVEIDEKKKHVFIVQRKQGLF